MFICGSLALLGFALVGCGSDDDGKSIPLGAAQTNTATAEADPLEDASPAEREVRATMARFQKAFYTGDAKGVCAMFTKKSAEETAATGNEGATCAEVIATFARPVAPAMAQQLKADILFVKVDGDKAIVRTSQSNNGQTLKSDLALVRQNGQWKFSEGLGGTPVN